MASLDDKMSAMAEQLLKRSLSEDEKNEIYRIADATGMRDVQSFLYLLLVFKLHEDTMNVKFAAMSELENRLQETLERSIERILDDGAARIESGMEAAVSEGLTDGVKDTLMSFGEYHSLRGHMILVCFICLISAVAYRLGATGALEKVPSGGAVEALLFLPAGWSVFFCGATYTFFWVGDHWRRVKKTPLYKTLLGLQIAFLLILALYLL